MSNCVTLIGYLRASGRDPFLRIYAAAFSGNYSQNDAEVLNFNSALNPYGIEYDYVPVTYPTNSPFVLGSTLGGWKAEFQIGGTSSAGNFGVDFFNGTTQLTAESYTAAGFPQNTRSYLPSGTWYGELLIGVLTAN